MRNTLENIKALVFDVDDTLVFTAQTGYRKCVYVAESLHLKPPTLEAFLAVYGRLSFNQCVQCWHPDLKDIVNYRVLYDQLHKLFPDEPCGNVRAVITRHKQLGMHVGILTNGPACKTDRKLQAVNVDPIMLDGIWNADNLQYLKPDPRAFNVLLNKWKFSPSEIVYVGDSLADMDAATEAGLFFVAVLTGLTTWSTFRPRLTADRILASIDNLLYD